MFFELLFRKLQEKQVDYMVVGGVALVLQGAIRMTADLDLMVALDEHNLTVFVDVMNEMGFKPKAPVPSEAFISAVNRESWIQDEGMMVFSFYHPGEMVSLVDVFVSEPIPYSEMSKRRDIKLIDDFSIPVASIQDLIKLKQIAGRPQDIEDIKALEALSNG
jgi:predicted nucleotidyltransferase